MKSKPKEIRIVGLALLIFLQCTILSLAGNNRSGGVLFNSINYTYDERTSLDLSPNNSYFFSDSFSLEFDISFWRTTEFGYVFSAGSAEGTYFDMVYIPYKKDASLLKLICNGRETGLNVELDPHQLMRNNWMSLRVDFDLKGNELRLYRCEDLLKSVQCDLPNELELNIVFGLNQVRKDKRIEVPRMAIKNIGIIDEKGEFEAFWALDEIRGGTSKDIINERLARIENPNWLIRNHYYWTKKATFFTDPMPGLAYDENQQRVLIINSDHLIDFRVKNNFYFEQYYQRGYSELMTYKYSIFDHRRNKVVSYGVDLKTVSLYDPQTNEWTFKSFPNHEERNYWNHSAFVDQEGNRLFTLGGYGGFSYNNAVNSYNFESQQWSGLQLKGDKMMPRCLAAVGKSERPHEYLLFGGYGNASGKQELGAKNFYDLYRLNLLDSTLTKVWDLGKVKQDFVPVHSLVCDPGERTFYTLGYPHKEHKSQLQLYRFSLDSTVYQIMSDPIPFELEGELKNDAHLFFNKQTKEFVAVTRTEITPDSSRVDIYTMFYPLLEDVSIFKLQKASFVSKYGLFFIIICVLALSCMVVWIERRKLVRSKQDLDVLETSVDDEEIREAVANNAKGVVIFEEEPLLEEKLSVPVVEDFSSMCSQKNAMNLFGSFQIFAADGADLSEEFSPKRLQLFLLMLLYPCFHPKGISSKKLTEILWPDHSPQRAKNNRGVNVLKIRSILEAVEGVEIVFKDNCWSVELEEPFVLDFYRYRSLKERMQKSFSMSDLEELLQVLASGEFLADMDLEWLENQKGKITDEVLDFLLSLTDEDQVIATPIIAIRLADLILKFDSVNDDALELKIQMLSQLGKHGQAKTAYTDFTREYYNLYQEDYHKSFPKIVGENHLV